MYRAAHLLADLSWVDLDFECSIICPVLLELLGIWQQRLDKCAIWWNFETKIDPTEVRDQMGHPVLQVYFQRVQSLHYSRGHRFPH